MLLPPKQGHRRPQFCGLDDTFWSTPDGEITSEPVEPKSSIWNSFKNMQRLGRKPTRRQRWLMMGTRTEATEG